MCLSAAIQAPLAKTLHGLALCQFFMPCLPSRPHLHLLCTPKLLCRSIVCSPEKNLQLNRARCDLPSLCPLLIRKLSNICFPTPPKRRVNSPNMGATERPPEVRSTLRRILRELLRCRAWSTATNTSASASGFSRRPSPIPPCLPQLSQISLFPNFESDPFGIDRYSVSISDSVPSRRSHLQSPLHESRLSLLPATRLSHFDLHRLYSNHVALPQRQVRYETSPETLAEGASHRASISTSIYQPSLRSVSSTLRIRGSRRFISNERRSTLATGASSPSVSSLRRAMDSKILRRKSSRTSFANRSADEIDSEIFDPPTPELSSNYSSRSHPSIHSVKHFGSFCVLDTFVSGCPVTATSEDLRYVFHVGDQFVLNIHECEGTSIDIVTGSTPNGEEVIHLVLFSPLLSPSTGAGRFILAALIDVTHFVREASQLPEMDTIRAESSSEDEAITPANTSPHSHWSTRNCELLADDLLGGCSITAQQQYDTATDTTSSFRPQKTSPTAIEHDSEDIWLALAREERLEKDWQRWADPATDTGVGRDVQRSVQSECTTASSSSIVVDEVLEEFMSSLQELYSESFLLARSPLDDKYFEICNVSPAVYASGEYVTGHLTHTAPNVIEGMSESLVAGKAFRTKVRWGSQGIEKWLYCIPLYGQSSITWICVLVDPHMPALW